MLVASIGFGVTTGLSNRFRIALLNISKWKIHGVIFQYILLNDFLLNGY